MSDKQWKGTTGGGKVGQKGLILFFRYLPLWLGYMVMALVVPFYMLSNRAAFRAIYHYFRRQHGEGCCRAFYHTCLNHYRFGQVILDRFAVFAGRASEFVVIKDGIEQFEALLQRPQGFVLAGCHFGNFEICGYLLSQNVKAIKALVFGGEGANMQQTRSQQMAQHSISMISVRPDMSHIFEIHDALTQGDIVSIPCDRVWGSQKVCKVPFLGAEANFPMGGFSVAVQSEVPVVAVFVEKVGYKRYLIKARQVTIDGEGLNKRQRVPLMIAAYASLLEAEVKRYPEQWFNYYEFWQL